VGEVSAGLRDLVREEHRVRRALAEAERWDAEALERPAGPHRAFAEREAVAARRRVVRVLLGGFLSPGRERDGLLVRLDAWLREEEVGADALDRLVEVLRPNEGSR
jgi:hypothetical protein